MSQKGFILKARDAVENWNSWADEEDKILNEPATPATDAAANALRAEGLEMLAEQCDGYALNHVYTYTKRHAKEFAKQLREGK